MQQGADTFIDKIKPPLIIKQLLSDFFVAINSEHSL